MVIKLYASTGSTSTLMGTAEISLSEVLIFPQNKIQLITKVISSECEHTDAFEKYCSCDVTMAKPKHLGNLTLWFRLTCELDVLKHYINNIEQWWTQLDKQENVWPNSVATGQDIVLAQKEQQKSTINEMIEYGQSAPNPNEPTQIEKMLITITIVGLKLNADVFEISDDAMESIHIECSFLGTRRLKTNPILLTTNELAFHFVQKFPHNEHNMQRLMNILADSEHSIKLVLVKTRQIPDENDLKNDSLEVGFGLLHLGKFIQEWNGGTNETGPHTFEVAILSKKPPYQNIGSLNISIEDIQSLKQLEQQKNQD